MALCFWFHEHVSTFLFDSILRPKMSFKSGYFCGFCQKKGCLSDNLQYCERCEIAIYCADSKKCKDQDWENHKSICGKVTYLQSLIPRIERNFYDFNLRSVPDEGIRSSSLHVFNDSWIPIRFFFHDFFFTFSTWYKAKRDQKSFMKLFFMLHIFQVF